jgi:hypothetical protein
MEIDLAILSPSTALAIRNALRQELTWTDDYADRVSLADTIEELEGLIVSMMGEEYLLQE